MRTVRYSKRLPAQLAPRLLDIDAASAYLTKSIEAFKRDVLPWPGITPILASPPGAQPVYAYDVRDLDAWVDWRKGGGPLTIDDYLNEPDRADQRDKARQG